MHVDTQAMVDELVKEGVKPKLAKVQVHQILTALNSNLATKEDFSELRVSFANLQTDVEQSFGSIRTEIANFQINVERRFQRLDILGTLLLLGLFGPLIKELM